MKKETAASPAAKKNNYKIKPNGKNDTGRPTKYKPEYCKKIIDYFNQPPVITTYKKTYYADGSVKSEEPVMLPCDFPSFQGFASLIEVDVHTLDDWCAEHSDFSTAYARAKQMQENLWLINGMNGQYNSQFAQFFGKNCLGYKDKTEQEVKADVTISEADRALIEKVSRRLEKDK